MIHTMLIIVTNTTGGLTVNSSSPRVTCQGFTLSYQETATWIFAQQQLLLRITSADLPKIPAENEGTNESETRALFKRKGRGEEKGS